MKRLDTLLHGKNSYTQHMKGIELHSFNSSKLCLLNGVFSGSPFILFLNNAYFSSLICPLVSPDIYMMHKMKKKRGKSIAYKPIVSFCIPLIHLIIIIIIMGDLYSAFHSTRRFTKISIHS